MEEIRSELPPARKYEKDRTQYILEAAMVTGDAAALYSAKHVTPEEGNVTVLIKKIDIRKVQDVLYLTNDIHNAGVCDHDNIVKVHCSFVIDGELWIVMPPSCSRGSIRAMIHSTFRHGLPEESVRFILGETLKALSYLHGKNKVHRSIGADCVFLDEKPSVKLSFLYLTMYEDHLHPGDSAAALRNLIVTPELTPEFRRDHDKATDIWMFGLLALELFYGDNIPASILLEFNLYRHESIIVQQTRKKNLPASKFIGKLGFGSCFCGKSKKRILEQELGEVIDACLSRDPTADQLMEFDYFRRPLISRGDSIRPLLKALK
ncbi:serine/threonine-protein kinase BLUS1-like [Andrographis paniculata]|uniref:serine/threonine-protein kinase BLUS1-like n=1 Tax=Andrographis paniculata TaxID=175694 RepID=UPI0021E76C30|nr:serine/threonine-protein kinase BLUS1-like [Andrographis paniculata]